MRKAVAVVTLLGILQRSLLFLLLPFVANAMSVEEYGVVSVMTVAMALTLALVGTPVEVSVTRGSVAQERKHQDSGYLGATKKFLGLIAPLAGLALAGVVAAVPGTFLAVPHVLWSLEIAAASLSTFALFYAAPRLRAIRSLRRYGVLTLSIIIATLSTKIWLVVVVQLGPIGWAISDLITAVVGFVAALAVLRRVDRQFAKSDFKGLFRDSMPLVPHALSNWLIGFLNRPLLILLAVPLADVGRYSMAYNASNAALIIAVEAHRALSVEYARDAFPAPNAETAQAMKIQFTGALVLATIVCAAAVPFVRLALPTAYDGIEPILGVLSLVVVAWTLYAVALNFIIQTARRSEYAWLASLVGAVVVVAVTALFVPAFGIFAASIAAVLCYASMAGVALLLTRKLCLEIDWSRGGISAKPVIIYLLVLSLAVIPIIGRMPDAISVPTSVAAVGFASAFFVITARRRGSRRND